VDSRSPTSRRWPEIARKVIPGMAVLLLVTASTFHWSGLLEGTDTSRWTRQMSKMFPDATFLKSQNAEFGEIAYFRSKDGNLLVLISFLLSLRGSNTSLTVLGENGDDVGQLSAPLVLPISTSTKKGTCMYGYTVPIGMGVSGRLRVIFRYLPHPPVDKRHASGEVVFPSTDVVPVLCETILVWEEQRVY